MYLVLYYMYLGRYMYMYIIIIIFIYKYKNINYLINKIQDLRIRTAAPL